MLYRIRKREAVNNERRSTVFNTVIEAIKRIHAKENLLRSDQGLLNCLFAEVDEEINLNSMNAMIYGERINSRLELNVNGPRSLFVLHVRSERA